MLLGKIASIFRATKASHTKHLQEIVEADKEMFVQSSFTSLDERPLQSLQEREQFSGTMLAPASGTHIEEDWLAAGRDGFSKTRNKIRKVQVILNHY